ncbi:MAG: hydrogenase formation protein HypD, partial [bacterium]|nr:hydrogenase formation protein HypD [bacterium]
MNLNNEMLKEYTKKLKNLDPAKQINIMEVCGTHTVQFFHTGVKDIF